MKTDFAAQLRKAFTSRTFLFSLLSVVVIAVLAMAFFHPDAMQGNVLRQHDMQQGVAIGQEAKAFHEATGETTRWTNSLFSGMPTFQISPSYPSNDLFTWINTVMGLGLPAPANILAMMMIGFFILLLAMKMRWWVALLGAVAYGFSSYFIILIGAGHIWKFITLAYIPPTIAGLVLAYRGRWLAGSALAALFAMMQIASNHVQMSYYFLFVILGFVVAYLIEALREKQMRRWLVATGALCVAGLLAVTANLPSLYNTYEYSKETMRGGHSELTREADPSKATGGLDRDYITQYSYQPSETFTFLVPNVKGGASVKPEQGGFKMLTLDALDSGKQQLGDIEKQYLQYMGQYFGDPEGTNGPVYMGALIVALFLLGCIICKGPLKWVLIVLTLLSVGLAWGRHMMWLTNLFIDYMPMYAKFRTVESILVIAEFTMPLLAAMALQKLFSVKREEARKLFLKPVCWSFGIAGALALIAAVAPSLYGDMISENDRQTDIMISEQLSQQGYDQATIDAFSLRSPAIFNAVTSMRASLVQADGWRSLLIVAAGLLLLLLYLYGKAKMAVVAAGSVVLVALDLFTVNKRYLDHDSFVPKQLTTGEPIAKTKADNAILADTTMNYRVLDIPRFYSADPSYYHKMIGGYHAAKLARYQDLIDVHLGHFPSMQADSIDMEVANMLNARYFVVDNDNAMINPDAFGNAWLVDEVVYVADADNEMAALSEINLRRQAVADGRFSQILGTSHPKTPGDTIFETSYAPNRLTYSAKTAKGGVAVFSEVYFPWGWKATIDGQPAELGRVNYVLRALRLPAGNHTIEMTFDPQSLHTTVTAAYIAVILIYLALIAAVAFSFARAQQAKDPEEKKA